MEGAAVNKRLVWLTALAALLGGYVVFEGLGSFLPGGGGDEAVVGAVVPRSTQVKLNPLEGLDPESYTAIVEQPLFNPTRQPRPTEPPPAPPEVEQPMVEEPPPPPPQPQGPNPEDYKLLGVSAGPDGRIAALRIASSGQVVYLRKGERLDSWSVVDVDDRSVAIGTEDNPVTFSMFASPESGEAGDEQMDGGVPAPAQPLPLPLPLPMPKAKQPAQQPGQPALPEQYTLPPDTGG